MRAQRRIEQAVRKEFLRMKRWPTTDLLVVAKHSNLQVWREAANRLLKVREWRAAKKGKLRR